MQNFIVVWTYCDDVGRKDNGTIKIRAGSREEAEKQFYQYNRPYVLGYENGAPVLSPNGGFVCECVLTYAEWNNEGCANRSDEVPADK